MPIPVFAAESNKQFSEETVITTENVYDVLSYLDIDENNLEVNQEASYATVTVGELKEAIDSAKKYQKEVEKDSTINIEDISSSPQSTRATYSKTLKHWTNASASNASVDSDFVIYTYKLSGQSNKTTCTSSCITLKCSGNLDTYVGVGNVGIVKITSQTYSSKTNFYASSYL